MLPHRFSSTSYILEKSTDAVCDLCLFQEFDIKYEYLICFGLVTPFIETNVTLNRGGNHEHH
jgi:hypothetical protein